MAKKTTTSGDASSGLPATSTPSPGDVPLDFGASAPAAAAYVVLARKYRPQTFDDLIGQDAMVTTLRNAFAADRIAQGYMLTGVRGVGKTTTARILARALNFVPMGLIGDDRPTIDLQKDVFGRNCKAIIEGHHPDVLEIDAASNTGVDNVRELIELSRQKPFLGRYRVFIIDEVHMLSKGAFNALLKTLEEPPPHVKFIFATTEIRKVPVTVLSRCQRFDLRRVDVPLLVEHFKKIVANEGAKAEDEALALIARAAEGSVRDGLSVLDQAIATSGASVGGASVGSAGGGVVTAADVRSMLGLADRGRLFDLLEHLFAGQAGAALDAFASLHHDGADPVQALGDLAEAVHLTTRIRIAGPEAAGVELSAEEKRRGTALSARLSIAVLSRAWQMLLKGLDEAGRAPNTLAAAEMVLVRVAHAADLPSPEELIARLGGGTVSRHARGAAGDVPPPAREERGPLNRAAAPRQISSAEPPPPRPDDYGAFDPGADAAEILDESDGTESPEAETARIPGFADPRSFLDVVELVGQKRDARLKVHLEESTSLVKFDPAGGIEIHLLPNAPPEMANELREKLNKWTGRRWMVAVSKARGERPLGEQRREREAAELEALKMHPAVAAVFEHFPDAKIASVKPVRARIAERDDDQAAG